MQQWQWTSCSSIYAPERGDPDDGIPPGTQFEELPDDWQCADCGAGREFCEPLG